MGRFIASIIFLAAAIGIFFAWTQPYFYEIKNLRAEQATLNDALDNVKQIQVTRDDLLTKYNSISQENIDKLYKILPPHSDSIKFIVELDGILQKNNLILKDITIKDETQKSNTEFGAKNESFETVPLSMKITGSYQSFRSFLNDLAKNLRLVNINSLSFSAGETNSYEYNIEAVFYWKK